MLSGSYSMTNSPSLLKLRTPPPARPKDACKARTPPLLASRSCFGKRPFGPSG